MGKSEKNNISSDQVATQVTFIKDTTKKTMTTDLLGPNHMQHQRQVVVVGKALYMAPPWSDFYSAIHRRSMKTKHLRSCKKIYLALINGLLVVYFAIKPSDLLCAIAFELTWFCLYFTILHARRCITKKSSCSTFICFLYFNFIPKYSFIPLIHGTIINRKNSTISNPFFLHYVNSF